MATGSKTRSSSEQKRKVDKSEQKRKVDKKVDRTEAGAKRRGNASDRAAQPAYATVNKQDQRGKKTGRGRGRPNRNVSSRAGGKASPRSAPGGERAQHARAGRAAHR